MEKKTEEEFISQVRKGADEVISRDHQRCILNAIGFEIELVTGHLLSRFS